MQNSGVVYHLVDGEKCDFALGNIANHFEGLGSNVATNMRLIVQAPALNRFKAAKADAAFAERLFQLQQAGLDVEVCMIDLRNSSIDEAALLPGVNSTLKPAVVRIAELQMLGYAYLRP